MATDHSKYPKQPLNPNRKPSESVTWVRNLEKHLNTPRVTVVVKKKPFTVPMKTK